MRMLTAIARLLLGVLFVLFGLNGFLNFFSTGPAPTGLAGQFIGSLFQSHYYWVIAALQIAGGVLLIVNRYVPLALVLLGPIIVNVLLYHIFMMPQGVVLAIVATVLWFVVFYGYRYYFSGVFSQRA